MAILKSSFRLWRQVINLTKARHYIFNDVNPEHHSITVSVRALNCCKVFSKNAVESEAVSQPGVKTVLGIDDKLRDVIKMEYEYLKVSGEMVPSELTDQDLEQLLAFPTKFKRRKHLRFLFKKERDRKADQNRKLRNKEKVAIRAELKQEQDEGRHIVYGVNRNTYLLRVHKSTMNLIANNRLLYANLFGQSVVFDMDYDQFMNNEEKTNTVDQLIYSYASNKRNSEPFNINFCNADRQTNLFHKLRKSLPNIEAIDFLCNVTNNCFMNTFPKDKLVYLSPDAPTELISYDHDAVYIIGSYVDKGDRGNKVSLAKAKRLGIKMVKLPLDKFLRFKGHKVLTIDQVFNILLTMKNTGKWHEALKFVPKRVLKD